jgi:hypothetical protein
MGTALDFFIQALQHVGALEMLMMLARQPIKAERLVEVVFDPGGQLGLLSRPFGEPGGEIGACLGKSLP